MTKKQIIILGVLSVFIVLGIIVGVLIRQENLKKVSTTLTPTVKTAEEIKGLFKETTPGVDQFYNPVIPKNATATVPKIEAPAAPNSNAKLGIFDMEITKNGYNPSSLTVKAGDRVAVNVKAVDDDYDILVGDFAYKMIKKGEVQSLGFSVPSLSGTFLFECRDACPSTGKIQGILVVLP